MPITPIGLNVNDSSACVPSSSLDYKASGCMPKTASKGITPIGLRVVDPPARLVEQKTGVKRKHTVSEGHQSLVQPCEKEDGMWLTKSHAIPVERLNGWVVSWVMESFLKEEATARACEKATYEERLAANGMASLSDAKLGPRKQCEVLKQAGEAKTCLVTETGQRAMLESVRDSLPSYISGVRC